MLEKVKDCLIKGLIGIFIIIPILIGIIALIFKASILIFAITLKVIPILIVIAIIYLLCRKYLVKPKNNRRRKYKNLYHK